MLNTSREPRRKIVAVSEIADRKAANQELKAIINESQEERAAFDADRSSVVTSVRFNKELLSEIKLAASYENMPYQGWLRSMAKENARTAILNRLSPT